MTMTYESELEAVKAEYTKTHSARQFDAECEAAEAFVRNLGFDGPADVRRVADKFGRRVA